MDIRRLGTRSVANLAYAYLITNVVDHAVALAEQQAVERKKDLTPADRRQVVEQAVRDFDTDLEREVTLSPGVDPERVSRARHNVRALGGLLADLEQANVAASD